MASSTKIKKKRRFATAINCMDGRVQYPVAEFMKKKYGVDYVDIATDTGPNRTICENTQTEWVESLKRRVRSTSKAHNSEVIAIAGHHDCVGNPADARTQIRQILESVEIIKTWDTGLPVIGIWVNENFEAVEVTPEMAGPLDEQKGSSSAVRQDKPPEF